MVGTEGQGARARLAGVGRATGGVAEVAGLAALAVHAHGVVLALLGTGGGGWEVRMSVARFFSRVNGVSQSFFLS